MAEPENRDDHRDPHHELLKRIYEELRARGYEVFFENQHEDVRRYRLESLPSKLKRILDQQRRPDAEAFGDVFSLN